MEPGRVITAKQWNQDVEEQAANAPKRLIKIGFNSNVVDMLPEGHLMRRNNSGMFPMSPVRKTVGEVVQRVKETLKVPCDIKMSMQGAVMMPECPANSLPSFGRLRVDRDYAEGRQMTTPTSVQTSPSKLVRLGDRRQ